MNSKVAMTNDGVEVVPGMGATVSVGSDCYPYTVVAVLSHRKCLVRRDNFRLDEHHYGIGFEPDLGAVPEEATRCRDGRWVVGRTKADGTRLTIGVRRAYLDPHF
jgi:hypothetical protein